MSNTLQKKHESNRSTLRRRWVDAVQELNHECSKRQGDVCTSHPTGLAGCEGLDGLFSSHFMLFVFFSEAGSLLHVQFFFNLVDALDSGFVISFILVG